MPHPVSIKYKFTMAYLNNLDDTMEIDDGGGVYTE